jgi:hypothetical protein
MVKKGTVSRILSGSPRSGDCCQKCAARAFNGAIPTQPPGQRWIRVPWFNPPIIRRKVPEKHPLATGDGLTFVSAHLFEIFCSPNPWQEFNEPWIAPNIRASL